MAKLVWKDEYNLGISEIDSQHKVFFIILNELYASVYSMSSEKKFDYFYRSLVEYVHVHFTFEEELFHKYSYPETEEHINEHKQFRTYLKEIKQKMANNELSSVVELVDFLRGWFANHILMSDMSYRQFLSQTDYND